MVCKILSKSLLEGLSVRLLDCRNLSYQRLSVALLCSASGFENGLQAMKRKDLDV